MTYEHHASFVIMHLDRRCAEAATEGRREEAVRLADLAASIEREFPEARDELDRLYARRPA